MTISRIVAVIALALMLTAHAAAPAFAVLPDEVLDDPALEARARAISVNLRCLVCQNQSIDDSNADLARDLRVLVRERLVVGDSDEQVIDYIVSRYGEFVLLKPRLSLHNLVLWIAPFGFLVGGGAAILFALRGRRRAEAQMLSAREIEALDKILHESEPENR